jgi:hypothetical protein
MRKLFVSLIAVVLLFTTLTTSRAIVYVGVTNSSMGNDWLSGIPGTGGNIVSIVGVGNFLTGGVPGTMAEFSVPPPSGLVYVGAQQNAVNDPLTDTDSWTNAQAWFDVIVSTQGPNAGDIERTFTVQGRITGATGTGTITPTSSSAFWVVDQVVDEVGNPVSFASADPINGIFSLQWDASPLGGTPVTLWIEGVPQTLNPVPSGLLTSIEGSVTSVPEPGSIALLISGLVVTVGKVIRRRK